MNSSFIFITSGIADYLLYASIIAAALVTIAWVIIKLGKIQAPVYHHMIWLCTLFAILILPVIWLYAPKVPVPVLPAQTRSGIGITQQIDIQSAPTSAENGPSVVKPSGPVGTALSSENQQNPLSSIPIKMILACLWSFGFLFMLVRLLINWRRINRIVRAAEPVIDDAIPPMSYRNEQTQLTSPRRRPGSRIFLEYWIPAFAGMTARLRSPVSRPRRGYGGQVHLPKVDGEQFGGITKCGRIRLLLSPHVDSPLCFGILRPVILLPKKMYAEGISEDLNMVLHHELAHIERRDCCVNIFQRLIEAVFFFHPFVWYASSQLTQNREILCDHHVLAKGASPTDYVRMLTRIVEQGFEKNNLHAVALFEGRLLSRVRAMLASGNKVQLKAPRKSIITGALVLLICMTLSVIQLAAKSSTDIDENFVPAQIERPGQNGNRPVGNCSISGKVVSAETGEPVGNANINLFFAETFDGIYIRTASDGIFEFKNIPTGPFSLTVSYTEGFKDTYYDPDNNSCGEIANFSLKEGENRTGVVLQLKPAEYSISGKVLNEDGQPPGNNRFYVDALVKLDEPGGNLNAYKSVGGPSIPYAASDGSYLIDGLDNSPVYIMVTEYESGNPLQPVAFYYYPGTLSRNQAEMVYFDKDKAVKDIDIKLTKQDGFSLEGFILDENTGKPVPNTLVTTHLRDMLFKYLTAYTDERGYYRFDNLSDGKYLVHVDAEPWGYVRTHKSITIEVEQSTKLDFTLNEAAVISGNFVDENGKPFEIANSAYGLAFKYGYPNPETMEWTGTMNKYSEKGSREHNSYNTFNGDQGDYEEEYMVFPTSDTFLIEGMLPGKTMLRFHPKEEGTIVKQILYNGRDIMETGIETSPGEKIEGVSIVIEGAKKRSSQSNKEKDVIAQQLEEKEEELRAQQLEERKGKGYIGVSIQTISSDLKDILGLKDTRGALVANVAENSPAAKAGIQVEDIIITFDGKDIEDSNELRQTVLGTTVGKIVKVDVLRKGDKNTFDLHLEEYQGSE